MESDKLLKAIDEIIHSYPAPPSNISVCIEFDYYLIAKLGLGK